MRCERCGATSPPDAQWCGQCYGPFGEPARPAEASPAGEPAPTVERSAPEGGTTARSGFRRRGDTLEWECVTCGQFNDIDRTTCDTCGTSIAARYETPEPEPEPSSWSAAFALTALLPGTGHYLAGRMGSGIARGLLFVVWLIGGVLLLAAGTGAAPAALPLLLGALVVWAGTLLDLVNVRRGERELLGGRALLWLVVGVTVLLLASAFGGLARLG